MIIGYVGTRGTGKTLSCIREAYEHYINGYEIYSNIKLNKKMFKKWNLLTGKDIEQFVKGNKQFKKAFFILDEAHIYLDSRMGMSNKNKIISYFILQTRKRNVRLGYTTQFFHQVDKRLRDPTEVKVICSNILTDKGQIQRNIVQDLGRVLQFEDRFYANDYFGYYDTNEIVNPFK